ncbi:acyl-CoA dehydrogenase family protein [Streptomyces gelaticus]
MGDALAEARELATGLIGDQPGSWDRAGVIPDAVVRELGAKGLLCAEVPREFGGLGLSSLESGELTAHVGSLCSSSRSLMTSQGMAAWTISRIGGPQHRKRFLPALTGGKLAAVAFSEPDAGSDLSAMETRIVLDGGSAVVDGTKVWITAAAYADVLVVFGRFGEGAAVVLVPASTPGVRIERIPDALGCRAAGHSVVGFEGVRVPAENVLPGAGQSPGLLVTTALAYGRMSVAWGCAGILRACLASSARHAATRRQFGRRLADHQLVARHLAELLMAEQSVTRACEHASRCWDDGSPEVVTASLLAKHVGATQAVRGAATAVQVLASAGARDGHAVARAHRDAKLMEIIEGSSEICQLALGEQALAVWA